MKKIMLTFLFPGRKRERLRHMVKNISRRNNPTNTAEHIKILRRSLH